MKATFPTKHLRDALTRAKDSLGTHHALPALGGVKVTVGGGDVTLTTTNLELTTELTVLGADALGDGEALIPHKALAALAKRLDGETVELSTEGEHVQVRSGDADVSLRLLPAEDYPATPPRAEGEADDLTEDMGLLFRLRNAASKEDRRPIMTGVRFCGEWVAATDSFRLAWLDRPCRFEGTVPAETLDAVRKAKTHWLKATGNGKRVTFDGATDRFLYTWHVGCIDGKFPLIEQVIPSQEEGAFTADRARLDKVTDRVAAVGDSSKAATPVVLTPEGGRLTLSAGSGEVGEASEALPCQAEGAPAPFALNPKYLREGLALFDSEQVRVSMRDELKPIIFRAVGGDERVGYLQMPVRL